MIKRTNPAWLKEGLLISGNWEPLNFRRRAGFARTNEAEWYEFEHSEASLKDLKEYHVNLIITHFHKGFGLTEEKAEIEKTANYIKAAHQQNIRVGVYIRFSDFNLETFDSTNSDAENWLQKGKSGNIEPYSYSQEFRGVICPTSIAYLNQLKKVIDVAVDIKADLLHFDGFRWWMKEPCHCDQCKIEFTKFLNHKYPSKEVQMERFGHTQIDSIALPKWPDRWWPDVIINPAHQEWVHYRTTVFTKAHQILCEYAYSKNDQIAIDFNCSIPLDYNGFLRDGVSFPEIAPGSHILWSEHGLNPPGFYQDKNHLYSGIRHFKYCESLNNMCLIYIKGDSEDEAKKIFAEALAFNAGQGAMTCSQHVKKEPYHEFIQKWSAFYRQNKNLYLETNSEAQVAVVRHSPTLSIRAKDTFPQIMLAEQMLIENQEPYLNIFEITKEALSRFSLVILPNVLCMNQTEADVLKEYVASGGSIMITGDTSLYDHWLRRWPDYLLRELMGAQILQPDYDFKSFGELFHRFDKRKATHGVVSKNYFKKGKVIYATSIEGNSNEIAHGVKDALFWKQNIDWCLQKKIKISAPKGVLVEIRKSTVTGNFLIHLINYSGQNLRNNIGITLDKTITKTKANIYSPDWSEKMALPINNQNDMNELIVPKVGLYTIVELL